MLYNTYDDPPFSLANGSRVCALVGVSEKEGNNTSTMSSSFSSFSCLILNWYDIGSFLFSLCVCVCVCNMMYTEENIIFD